MNVIEKPSNIPLGPWPQAQKGLQAEGWLRTEKRTPPFPQRLMALGLALTIEIGMAILGLALMIQIGTASAAETASFEIVARDGRLYPERLEVPAGVKLKLTLRNEGKTPVELENLELRIERVLAPDAATSITVQALKPGSYSIIDDFHADDGKMLLIAR